MYARTTLCVSASLAVLFAVGCGGGGSTGGGGSGGTSSASDASSSSSGSGCATETDCPIAPNACVIPTCVNAMCGTSLVAAGTPVPTQVSGDCKTIVCDGNGAPTSKNDDTDVPLDGNECTDDVCTAGVPSNPPRAGGAACGQGKLCDGNGACVDCLMPSDCPGQDTACQSRTCTAGKCGTSFVPADTPVPMQVVGDCKVSVCDGNGAVTSKNDDADIKVDGNECTNDVCSGGIPSNPPTMKGAPCGQGMLCDGAGSCAPCMAAAECPGQDTVCQSRTCTAGKCGIAFVPSGTPVPMQMAGDCKVAQCDGAGMIALANDDTDLPVDGKVCTTDVCAAGVPSNPPLAVGTACNQDGGSVCDVAGSCVPTFVVVRVGTGMAALTSDATAVYLEQYLIDGTLLPKANNPLALPTAVNGNNRPLTVNGTSTYEGNLSLSANGSYLTLAGYDAVPGTMGVSSASAATINRVVGRIDASFNVDTSTRLNAAFSGSNVRGATTVDGTAFWVSGNSSGGSGGIHYALLGALGSTQILTAPNNARACHIQAGQLYGSSGSSPFTNIFSIGLGTPTMAGQTATSLPGMPTMTASPDSFAFFDRDPNVAGVDTLYVADDRALASGGGVQKWIFDGATWTLAATFTNGITTGVRGLAGLVTGNNVTIVATTSNGKVVVYVDDGSMNPPGTIAATAAANTAYRGVAFSPQ